MSYGIENAQMIQASKVFLDLENPRSPDTFPDEDAAIQWLCKNEDVLNLAKDIHEIGPNPLELIAVMKKGSAYIALEGNRRVCAVLLLNDPDRAPSNLRDRFKKLAESWTPVTELFCVEFQNRNDVQIWLDRIHGGKDEGRGRSQWTTEMKARRTKSSSAKSSSMPMAVLDYAEEHGFISSAERQGKVAIVQRFTSNPVFKNALGLEKSDDGFTTNLPKSDFDALLNKLITDMLEQEFKAHKINKDEVVNYVNNDLSQISVSNQRTAPNTLKPRNTTASSGQVTPTPTKPTRPKAPTKVSLSVELEKHLESLGNYKLRKLYYSLTSISAKDNCPLLYVCLWSLIECLTALDGRKPSTDFVSYLNAQRLENMGFGNKQKSKSMRDALARVSQYGNGTKHDGEAAGFSVEQLVNDAQVVEKALKYIAQKLADEAKN